MATTPTTRPDRDRDRDIPLDRLDSTRISTSLHHGDSELATTTSHPARPPLPPVDGGRQAWAYLLSATVLETLVWGFPLSYGVFLSQYLTIWPEATSILPQVGTVSTGIMYLFLPPLALVLAKRPHRRPTSMWLGMLVSTSGILASGFTTRPWQLLITQGVMYAIGGIFLYCPVTSYMFEWWQKRRGLASGILFSGTGLGGLTVPFIASALLETYGRRVTCIAFSIAYAVILALTIPFVGPRIPLTDRSTNADAQRERARIDWGFLRGRAFWLLACGVVLQGLGGFVPGTYLPSFAESIHLSNTTGTLSLALMNLARIPGQIVIGHLSDLVEPRRLILTMAGLSAASVYGFWGRADGEPLLLVFSLMFGAFAGSYTALFPRFIAIVSDNDPNLPPILYALFSFARGVGNIVSGPLSTRLLASHSQLGSTGGYGAPGYGVLIIFTGASLAASGVGAAYKGLKRE